MKQEYSIATYFHYIGLHKSPFSMKEFGGSVDLPNTDIATLNLVRLPLWYGLSPECIFKVVESTIEVVNRLS